MKPDGPLYDHFKDRPTTETLLSNELRLQLDELHNLADQLDSYRNVPRIAQLLASDSIHCDDERLEHVFGRGKVRGVTLLPPHSCHETTPGIVTYSQFVRIEVAQITLLRRRVIGTHTFFMLSCWDESRDDHIDDDEGAELDALESDRMQLIDPTHTCYDTMPPAHSFAVGLVTDDGLIRPFALKRNPNYGNVIPFIKQNTPRYGDEDRVELGPVDRSHFMAEPLPLAELHAELLSELSAAIAVTSEAIPPPKFARLRRLGRRAANTAPEQEDGEE